VREDAEDKRIRGAEFQRRRWRSEHGVWREAADDSRTNLSDDLILIKVRVSHKQQSLPPPPYFAYFDAY
jgi:hypothetical protein